MRRLPGWFCWARLVSVVLLCGTGCASLSQPMSASFAAVTISGAEPAAILAETRAVFVAEDWQPQAAAAGLRFDREGTRFDHMVYGLSPDAVVRIRSEVQAVPLADGRVRLQCQAYAVTCHGGQPGEPVSLPRTRAAPFQQLLDKVAAHFVGIRS